MSWMVFSDPGDTERSRWVLNSVRVSRLMRRSLPLPHSHFFTIKEWKHNEASSFHLSGEWERERENNIGNMLAGFSVS